MVIDKKPTFQVNPRIKTLLNEIYPYMKHQQIFHFLSQATIFKNNHVNEIIRSRVCIVFQSQKMNYNEVQREIWQYFISMKLGFAISSVPQFNLRGKKIRSSWFSWPNLVYCFLVIENLGKYFVSQMHFLLFNTQILGQEQDQ